MRFLEKNLEQIIYETPNDLLNKRGLPICGLKKRQVNIGQYGIADLITLDRMFGSPTVTIYEMKLEEINFKTFFQAVRYARGVQRYLNKNHPSICYSTNIVLVGKTLNTSEDTCYLPAIFHNVRIFTYEYSFDGISFTEQESYSLRSEGF